MGRPALKRDSQGQPMRIPAFGPPIPVVPRRDIDVAVDEKTLTLLWEITGPSAMYNLERGQPLWAVIACAYAEGLNHASGILAEMHRRDNPTENYREVPVKKPRAKK